MTAEVASIRRRAAGMATVIADALPDGAKLLHKSCSDVSFQSHLVIEMAGTRYAIAIAVVGRADELPKPEELPG